MNSPKPDRVGKGYIKQGDVVDCYLYKARGYDDVWVYNGTGTVSHFRMDNPEVPYDHLVVYVEGVGAYGIGNVQHSQKELKRIQFKQQLQELMVEHSPSE